MVVGIVLCVLGVAGVVWGAFLAFNLRGAVDRSVRKRNEIRALNGARTGDLTLMQPSSLGAWFFRLCGTVIMVGSPVLILVGLFVATES